MWIERLRGSSFEERHAYARSAARHIAAYGDNLLWRSDGKTALAFNKLAQGIACAAYQPGGIRTFGLRFEATPCAEIHDSRIWCDTCRPGFADHSDAGTTNNG